MKTVEIVYSLIAGLFTLCLGALAWFSVRLVDQYDSFQRETKANIDALRSGITSQKRTIDAVRIELKGVIREEGGVDKETKAKISSLLLSVAKIEKEIVHRIIPMIELAREDHGKLVVLEDSLKMQEKNLKKVYDSVMILAQKKR